MRSRLTESMFTGRRVVMATHKQIGQIFGGAGYKLKWYACLCICVCVGGGGVNLNTFGLKCFAAKFCFLFFLSVAFFVVILVEGNLSVCIFCFIFILLGCTFLIVLRTIVVPYLGGLVDIFWGSWRHIIYLIPLLYSLEYLFGFALQP